jgi:hypothetical protein
MTPNASFVISLSQATARRERFAPRATAQGWEWEYMEAADWRDLKYQPKPHGAVEVTHPARRHVRLLVLPRVDYPQELTRGEIACAVSHMELWRMVIQRNLAAAYVFEDDAVIEAPPLTVPLPADADIVFVDDVTKAALPAEAGEDWLEQHPFAAALPGGCAFAYCITQQGARKALALMSLMKMPVDLQILSCAHGISGGGYRLFQHRGSMPELEVYVTTEHLIASHDGSGPSYIAASGPRPLDTPLPEQAEGAPFEFSQGLTVFGIGTGRCGTASLAALLSWQLCGTVTHEVLSSNVPWDSADREAVAGQLKRALPEPHRYLRGDVASYWLPYLLDDRFLKLFPNSVVIHIKRPRDEVVASFLRKTMGRNHWQEGAVDVRPCEWDQCFPKFCARGKTEALRAYHDHYMEQASMLKAKLGPERFYEVSLTDLTDEAAAVKLLRWLGISAPRWKPIHDNRSE